MTTELPDERRVGDAIRAYANSGAGHRDAADVVARVSLGHTGRRGSWLTFRPLRLVGAAAAVVLVMAVSGAGGLLIGGVGTGASMSEASVNGLDYAVAIAPAFEIDGNLLSPYSSAPNPSRFHVVDDTAYRIAGVDPRQILVMRLEPGQRTDEGPAGDYILLVRGPEGFGPVCSYFDVQQETTPRVCR